MTTSDKLIRRLVTLIAAAVLLFGAATAQAQTVIYYHTDALGSPVATTDASGNVIERSEYEPYGRLLNRPLTDGPGYTGHVSDAATGLSYMQQRYYDPGIGRFLSRDPVTANANTGANFNSYWYANNNPYRFTDPDGRQSLPMSVRIGTDDPKIQEAFAGAQMDLVVSLLTGTDASYVAPNGSGAVQSAFTPIEVAGASALARGTGALVNAARSGAAAGTAEGPTIFRVYGEKNNPMGQSWTPTDPRSVSNFRDAAGLPDVNSGRFVAEGKLMDSSGVTVRSALPLDGNKGGLPEWVIPNAAEKVRIDRVSGVNPEF